MPVYIKEVSTGDRRFQGRSIGIYTADSISNIPVPDNVVLCDGCNVNIAETEEKKGYLVYLDKRELAKDQPYDFYCGECVRRYFPKAQKA